MIRKHKPSKIKNKFFVLVFAVILVFIILYLKKTWVVENSLKSNILSIREDQINNKIGQSEIIYELSTWNLKIYANQVFDNLSWMDMKLFFDEEKINILNKDISSDLDYNITKDTWSVNLYFGSVLNLKSNQQILFLTFSWNKNDIVLWEVKIKHQNWKEKSLSIGRE